MSSLLRTIPALVVSALLAAPSGAFAQDPGSIPVPLLEVSAGYMFMRDVSSDLPEDVNFPAGWYFSGAFNPNQWLGLVGEVSGSHKNNYDFTIGDLTFSNKVQVYTFMGGPRFFHKVGRVVPFAQVLVGGAHMRLKTRFPEEIPIGTVEDRATEFAVQPGAGVTIYLTERVGLRLAGDYRSIIDFVEDDNEYANEFRFIAGFTMQWGAR